MCLCPPFHCQVVLYDVKTLNVDVNLWIPRRTHVEVCKRYRIPTWTPPAPWVNTHRRRSCAVRPERSARTARRSWAAPPFPCGSTWLGCPPCHWCSRCSPVGTRGGAPLTRRGRWDEGGRTGKNNDIRQVPSTESLFTKADMNGSRVPAVTDETNLLPWMFWWLAVTVPHLFLCLV